MDSNLISREEKQILDNSVNYMEKCEQGLLINPGPFKSLENPKI